MQQGSLKAQSDCPVKGSDGAGFRLGSLGLVILHLLSFHLQLYTWCCRQAETIHTQVNSLICRLSLPLVAITYFKEWKLLGLQQCSVLPGDGGWGSVQLPGIHSSGMVQKHWQESMEENVKQQIWQDCIWREPVWQLTGKLQITNSHVLDGLLTAALEMLRVKPCWCSCPAQLLTAAGCSWEAVCAAPHGSLTERGC